MEKTGDGENRKMDGKTGKWMEKYLISILCEGVGVVSGDHSNAKPLIRLRAILPRIAILEVDKHRLLPLIVIWYRVRRGRCFMQKMRVLFRKLGTRTTDKRMNANNKTRSGPKIPAADQLEGEASFGFWDAYFLHSWHFEFNFLLQFSIFNFVRTSSRSNFVRTSKIRMF